MIKVEINLNTMEKHKIDWLNMPGYKGETWNPIIGCSKISEGCKNCYAEKMAGRLANIGSTSYYGNVTRFKNVSGGNEFEDPDQWSFEGWNGKTHFVETNIIQPMSWKKPRMVFVCSMADLFHESVTFPQIDEVVKTIVACPQHIFILLTKRPDRMRKFFYWKYEESNYFGNYPIDNIWLGTTAENQKTANERIPILLDIPAAKRFVSIEPMLGEIDLSKYLLKDRQGCPDLDSQWPDTNGNARGPVKCVSYPRCECGKEDQLLNWVICGGESGSNARPMHPDWARSIRDQCKEAGTHFFFKGWGEYRYCQFVNNPYLSSYTCEKLGKSKTGSELDGHHHKEFPA